PRYLQVNERAKLSYVTGSHTFKVGMQGIHGTTKNKWETNDYQIALQVLNGVPRQIVEYTTPYETNETVNYDMGFYADDQWTVKRLTVNGGLRFDFANASIPEQHLPPVRFQGARDFAAVSDVPNWKDVSPRFGGSMDVFGDGRTAIKGSLGRY